MSEVRVPTGAPQDHAAQVGDLYARYAARIQRRLARLVGNAEADDLMHDVFEKAYRALPEHRGESQVSTWLYRIATHVALDRLRNRAVRERENDGLEAENRTAQCLPDVDLVRARMSSCMAGLVQTLPAGQREVMELAELRGLSDRETAEALGITVGAAKIRLHRARAALKKRVECECRTYHDADNRLTCEPVRPLPQRGSP